MAQKPAFIMQFNWAIPYLYQNKKLIANGLWFFVIVELLNLTWFQGSVKDLQVVD